MVVLGACTHLPPVAPVDAPPATETQQPDPVPEAPLEPSTSPTTVALPVPAQPRPFLDELRRSFRLDHHAERSEVQRQIAIIASQPAAVARLDDLSYVCAEVRARDLPGELCLLPIIESRVDPFARSSVGAAGIWQFMPGTARRFGLKMDRWADERLDVVLATAAALDYLEELHTRFEDWLLALGAYNCGAGCLERALRRTSGGQTEFFDLRLPRETQTHVAKLLGLAAIFAAPALYSAELPFDEDAPAETKLALVPTGGQIDIAQAAAAIGKPPDYLYARNPALKRWATHPSGPHRLIVDAADGENARTALARIPEDERMVWQRVRIAHNDTLGELAQRFGTDVATLQQMNGLRSTVIRVGDELLVPAGGGKWSPGSGAFAAPQRASAKVYIVKAGDSIWRIARRLGLDWKALMAANGIGPDDILRIGQRLVVTDR